MSFEDKIARPYARALFEWMCVESIPESAHGLDVLLERMDHQDARRFLNDPRFSVMQQYETLLSLWSVGQTLHVWQTHFLKLLLDHRRFFVLPAIVRALHELFQEHAKQTMVWVETPYTLSPEDKLLLKNYVGRLGYSNVVIQEKYCNDLMAGVRMRIADRVIDISVKEFLSRMFKTLVGS